MQVDGCCRLGLRPPDSCEYLGLGLELVLSCYLLGGSAALAYASYPETGILFGSSSAGCRLCWSGFCSSSLKEVLPGFELLAKSVMQVDECSRRGLRSPDTRVNILVWALLVRLVPPVGSVLGLSC